MDGEAVGALAAQKLEQVATGDLKPHPSNPNSGDVGVIAESIKVNGFYGAIVAQRSTGFILAGNHRWQAARAMKLDDVPVFWLDVNDEEAARILAVDNRSTRLGHDDESVLVDLLTQLSMTDLGLAGTGYDGDDLDKMLRDVSKPEPVAKTKVPVVVVECDSDEEQTNVLNLVRAKGFSARAESR